MLVNLEEPTLLIEKCISIEKKTYIKNYIHFYDKYNNVKYVRNVDKALRKMSSNFKKDLKKSFDIAQNSEYIFSILVSSEIAENLKTFIKKNK